MSDIVFIFRDSSDTVDLCSEQQLVREISSHAPSLFPAVRADESAALTLAYLPPKNDRALHGEIDPDLGRFLESSLWAQPSQPSAIGLLLIDNLRNRDDEPEDSILAAPGILPGLIAQARKVPPSTDWERDLDEL